MVNKFDHPQQLRRCTSVSSCLCMLMVFLLHLATADAQQTILVNSASLPDPVQGPIPTNGAVPLFGEHKGTNAIMALACDPGFGCSPALHRFKLFMGRLRAAGYTDDIVLGVSPVRHMKPGVEDFLRQTGVVTYPLELSCKVLPCHAYCARLCVFYMKVRLTFAL